MAEQMTGREKSRLKSKEELIALKNSLQIGLLGETAQQYNFVNKSIDLIDQNIESGNYISTKAELGQNIYIGRAIYKIVCLILEEFGSDPRLTTSLTIDEDRLIRFTAGVKDFFATNFKDKRVITANTIRELVPLANTYFKNIQIETAKKSKKIKSH